MSELKNMLHHSLDATANKDQFWQELMQFVEEKLKTYNIQLKQAGIDLALLKNINPDDSVGKSIRQIQELLMMLSRWSMSQEEQQRKMEQQSEQLLMRERQIMEHERSSDSA